jgi:quinol monooxygenase YgiN
MAGVARAQPAGGAAIYGVTSVDVAPSATAQGAALLKRYRDAAVKQPGNLEVDLLQQIGWPNRFVIYEGWKDRASYAANEKAAHTADFCLRLKSISNAPCDRRDYFVVSVGPSLQKSAGPPPVYMMLHLDILPYRLDPIAQAATKTAEAARSGEGALRYDVVQAANIPTNYFTIFAVWRNRKAFDDYETSGFARDFRGAVSKVLGSPYDDRLFSPID